MKIQKVVLASGNAGKICEIQQGLGGSFELVSQAELGVSAPPENGLTFVENALIKARAASEQTDLPAIADDSGLSVDALGGAPGIYSARFSGSNATDSANNALLLQKLQGLPEDRRTASFQCALVYMRSPTDPVPLICQGYWKGRILDSPRGTHGFGYDPLFYAIDQGCTSAELSPEVKNRVSHRGKALTRLVNALSGHTDPGQPHGGPGP